MTLYTSWRDKIIVDYERAVRSVVCAACGAHAGGPCINPTFVVHEVRRNQAIVEGLWDPTKVSLDGVKW